MLPKYIVRANRSIMVQTRAPHRCVTKHPAYGRAGDNGASPRLYIAWLRPDMMREATRVQTSYSGDIIQSEF